MGLGWFVFIMIVGFVAAVALFLSVNPSPAAGTVCVRGYLHDEDGVTYADGD